MNSYQIKVFAQDKLNTLPGTDDLYTVNDALKDAASGGWEPHLMSYNAGGQLVIMFRRESN